MVVNAMLRSDQNDKKPAIKTNLKMKNKFKIAYWNLCWANRLAVINHLIPLNFFYVGSPSGVHLFDHLLWSIF